MKEQSRQLSSMKALALHGERSGRQSAHASPVRYHARQFCMMTAFLIKTICRYCQEQCLRDVMCWHAEAYSVLLHVSTADCLFVIGSKYLSGLFKPDCKSCFDQLIALRLQNGCLSSPPLSFCQFLCAQNNVLICFSDTLLRHSACKTG